jgi:hypothetical protein
MFALRRPAYSGSPFARFSLAVGSPFAAYFEYNSTISCSFTGRLMSSRFGNDSTLPLKLF